MSVPSSASSSNESQILRRKKITVAIARPLMGHDENMFPNRRASVFHNNSRGLSKHMAKRLSKSETDLSEHENKLYCNTDKTMYSIIRSEVKPKLCIYCAI